MISSLNEDDRLIEKSNYCSLYKKLRGNKKIFFSNLDLLKITFQHALKMHYY